MGAGGLVLVARPGRLGGSPGAGAFSMGAFNQRIRPEPVPDVHPSPAAAPSIITRAEWGADESLRRGTPVFGPPRKLVVHHTAIVPTGDLSADIRETYRLHLTRDGATWADIGYHYLVDPEGRVYEGRWARDYADGELHDGHDPFGRIVQGSHSLDLNAGTVGIALMGDFSVARPSDPALNTLVEVIAWLCARHGLDPHGAEPFLDVWKQRRDTPTIIGHRDVRTTACPGQTVYDLVPELRQRVADRIGAVTSPSEGGYRILTAEGMIAQRGSATDIGDPARAGVVGSFVGLAGTGTGSWVADVEGGIFSLGDAAYAGSVPELRNAGLTGPIQAVAVTRTHSGRGYWVLDHDGGVFAFGDAPFHGSVPEQRADGASIPFVTAAGMALTPSGGGYWIVERNGGVFSFGDARYAGSLPELVAAGVDTGGMPAVDIAAKPSGNGYWILDRRGGVFAFGDAEFHGSAPQFGLPGAPARRLVAAPDGSGYLVLCEDGAVLRFGGAPFAGHGPRAHPVDLALG